MCSTTKGNKSFPIQLGFTPTEELYTQVKDTFSIEIQWGKRAIPPSFRTAGIGKLDEGETSNTTTIRYRGIQYSLVQAQISRPTHNDWILSSVKKEKNIADLVLFFKTQDSKAVEPYIFLVIPLLQETIYSSDPLYLQALSGQTINGTFSLDQCLPKSEERDYGIYTTCLNPSAKSAVVLVFYQGRPVSQTTLSGIRTKMAIQGLFPSISVPPEIMLDTPMSITQSAFSAAVRISNLGRQESRGGSAKFREDDTNAYTCVPLDPDKDVENGKIYVDTDTGEVRPMKEILEERNKARKAGTGKALAPGELEKYIAIFVGILGSLLLVIGLIYLYFYISGRMAEPGGIPGWLAQAPTTSIAAVVFCFLGFLIGVFSR